VQCEQIEAIMREQPKPSRQCGQFIEVDQQPKGAVAELMHGGPQPTMHHRADIEGGSESHP
jgi:hypothetical protein